MTDGYDIFVHQKNGWVNPGKDGVALNMDREKKELQWMKMEEIMKASKDRFMDSDVPYYTVMAEAIQQINEAREVLIKEEEQFVPMMEEIEQDKKERQIENEEGIRQMGL